MLIRKFRPGPRRQGVAATELALLLPILAILFVIALDYSRIFYYSIIVDNCARNGALYGSANPTRAVDTSGIQSAAQTDASNLTLSSLNVTSTTDNNSNPSYVDVTVTYPFTTLTNYPGVPRNTTLSRTVRMQVVPWTPDGG